MEVRWNRSLDILAWMFPLYHFQGCCITKLDAVILSEAKDLLFFEVSNPLREKQILRAPASRDPQNDVIGGNDTIHQR